jgi:hypothetical protein
MEHVHSINCRTSTLFVTEYKINPQMQVLRHVTATNTISTMSDIQEAGGGGCTVSGYCDNGLQEKDWHNSARATQVSSRRLRSTLAAAPDLCTHHKRNKRKWK